MKRHLLIEQRSYTCFIVSFVVVLLACAYAVPVMSSESSGPYRLGPEDTINVIVARHPEFSGEFYVPSDGIINVPAVGKLEINGKTLDELSGLITTRLRDRLREPEVSVTLKTPRMQRVYVLGTVQKPGLYDLKPGWRITEAMAAAGGLVNGIEASDCSAVILRASSGERQTFKLTEVLSGPPETNVTLDSGDVVTVDAQETLPIYVMGRVKTPGLYRLRRDGAGVMEALTLAGGTLEDSAVSRVTITHLDGSSTIADLTPAIIEGKQFSPVKLAAGDLIVVPEETARVAVLGFVAQPGFYPLRDGQKLTLSDALGLARGVDPKRGSMTAIGIIRTHNGKQEKLVFNLNKFLKSGDLSQNPEIKSGDVVYVPQTDKPDWDILLRALSSVAIMLNPFL